MNRKYRFGYSASPPPQMHLALASQNNTYHSMFKFLIGFDTSSDMVWFCWGFFPSSLPPLLLAVSNTEQLSLSLSLQQPSRFNNLTTSKQWREEKIFISAQSKCQSRKVEKRAVIRKNKNSSIPARTLRPSGCFFVLFFFNGLRTGANFAIKNIQNGDFTVRAACLQRTPRPNGYNAS